MRERLQKYLAAAGVASRRKAEEMIAQGRVVVNGTTVVSQGVKIDPVIDEIVFDGQIIKTQQEFVYFMLHKPEGYIASAKDQFNRPTVMDLLPKFSQRLYPVGRLDYDTSGLMLITNDGALTQALTHPARQIEKIYVARVRGVPTSQSLEKFRRGLDIENYHTASADIQILQRKAMDTSGDASIKIIIHEGKNRQVRKMCEAIGHPVKLLKRVGTGKIFLGNLKKGSFRRLTQAEIRYLKSLV